MRFCQRRVRSDLVVEDQHVIDDLPLTTGTNGTFDVKVDDELVYSKKKPDATPKTEKFWGSSEISLTQIHRFTASDRHQLSASPGIV